MENNYLKKNVYTSLKKHTAGPVKFEFQISKPIQYLGHTCAKVLLIVYLRFKCNHFNVTILSGSLAWQAAVKMMTITWVQSSTADVHRHLGRCPSVHAVETLPSLARTWAELQVGEEPQVDPSQHCLAHQAWLSISCSPEVTLSGSVVKNMGSGVDPDTNPASTVGQLSDLQLPASSSPNWGRHSLGG